MTTVTASRGPQVILEGLARAAARGGLGRTMRENVAAMDLLVGSGLAPDGNTVDGTSRTGAKAYDAVIAQFPDEPLDHWEIPAPLLQLNNAVVTSDGSTTARSLGERFGEMLNVKDFGAVLDGVADDTAAFNAARAAAANGQTIYVPNGRTANITTGWVPDTSKQVRWMFDGTTFPSGVPIVTWGPTNSGDVLENFLVNGGVKYLGKRSNPAASTSLMRLDYILDFVGGSSAFLETPFLVNVVKQDGVLNQLWAANIVVDNFAGGATADTVGLQVTGRKRNTGLVQTIQATGQDTTGLPSLDNGSGFNVLEIAQRANNIDNGPNPAMWGGVGIRVVQHLNQTIQNPANDIETSFGAGLFISTDAHPHVYVFAGIAAAMNYQTYQFIDTRGCIPPYVAPSAPVAAVRMLHDQIIDFNGGPNLASAGGAYLQYRTATSRLYYVVGGVDKFSIDASGNVRAAGTLTGSTTP